MFPKTLEELRTYIINVWRPSIESNGERVDKVQGEVGSVRIITEVQQGEIDENYTEILATKQEVKEVRDLLILLILDLAEMGLIENPELLELLNEI